MLKGMHSPAGQQDAAALPLPPATSSADQPASALWGGRRVEQQAAGAHEADYGQRHSQVQAALHHCAARARKVHLTHHLWRNNLELCRHRREGRALPPCPPHVPPPAHT